MNWSEDARDSPNQKHNAIFFNLLEPLNIYISLESFTESKNINKNIIFSYSLKLGNLFLSDRMQLKVGDFGLAAKVVFEGEKKRTICGTPNYIAPEILDAKIGHSYEVDYWSIGVILYTLLVGRPPFESPEVKQTYKKIKAN